MIATDVLAIRWLVRAAAPVVWRTRRKMARKLEGFACTEAGSALDMLKAAELSDDARLRRLFFRHAMDEARHAQLFRAAATQIDPEVRGSEYQLIHATRQNLYERMDLTRFIAFVYLAERRGEAQFRALERHFHGHEPLLEQVFGQVGRDEKFHVAYSQKLLARWRREGKAREVRRALARVRADRAWQAWRRSGRVIGDLLTRALLSLIYLVVLPVFVVTQRVFEPERAGWKKPRRQLRSLDDARRQS